MENEVYPKVKVRGQEQDNDLLPLQVKETQDDSPSSVAKVTQTYFSKLPTPCAPLCKGSENNPQHTRDVRGEMKVNVRASSVPRPRAVLSSPDNDKVVGNRRKFINRRPPSVSKEQILDNQFSPSKAQIDSDRDIAEGILKMRREAREVIIDNKSGLEQNNSLEPAISRQKTCLRK